MNAARTIEDDMLEVGPASLISFHGGLMEEFRQVGGHPLYPASFSLSDLHSALLLSGAAPQVRAQLMSNFYSLEGARAIYEVVEREGTEPLNKTLYRALDYPKELAAAALRHNINATPFIYAYSSVRFVRRLIGSGTQTQEDLAKYLRIMGSTGNTVAVYLLLLSGADPTLKDKHTGLTPIDFLIHSCERSCNIANVMHCKHAESRVLMCGCLRGGSAPLATPPRV